MFNLGILIADHGCLSFTPFSRLAADNPSQYARSIKLDAEQGFAAPSGVSFLTDLSADACSLLLKKVSSRIRKKRGDVVGRDTRPFHVPPAVNSLNAEALSVLAGHRGYLDTSSIHELDVAGARALSAYEGCSYTEVGKWNKPYMYRLGYTLGGLKELSEEVAAELSRFDDEKPAWVTELKMSYPSEYESARISHDFSGLTSISPEVLQHLAKLNGHLDLSGLDDFDKEHAEAMHDHVGGVLLNGLTSMSPDVAEELAKMKPGEYYVNDGWLYGAGLIDLSGMLNLDAKTCSNLLDFDGSVSLGCFDVLTADLANVLKDHGHRIFLKWLSHEQAAEEILSQRRDLEAQFKKGADWHEPTLPMMEGFILTRSLSYRFPGQICISHNEEAAELLSRYEGALDLSGLTSLSDAAAESLSKHKGRILELSGLTSLTDAAAESLSRGEGDLNLSGLTSLTDAAAESLSRYEGTLNLRGLTSLTDAAAESLSRYEGTLNLSGLTSLTDAAAESLSKHQGPLFGTLFLDGLTELSEAAAKSLSKHKGTLSLSGLTELSDAAVKSLSKLKMHLNLGVTSLTDAAAESMSKDGGLKLYLNGLTSLTDVAAESLSRYEGTLTLNGLTSLTDAAAKSLSKHKRILELSDELADLL
ncbi:hypothetical protein OAG31_03250 [Akkermansiaceae bacterium]|nr:hypothetical protein [Akkermansiaceae bacterium]